MIVTRAMQAVVARKNAGGASLLLDDYTAAHAYSLRKLRTAYSGSAIRVRRSSDNAEQDIGFSGTDLDTASLESFCGAGNGFIVTWYDQAGSANLTNATAFSQPQIVASGTTITDGTKPAATCTTSSLYAAGVSLTQPNTTFIVYSGNAVSADYLFDGQTARQVTLESSGDYTFNAGASSSPGVANRSTFTQAIDAIVWDGASSEYFQDGSTAGTFSPGTAGLTGFYLASRNNAGSNWPGDIAEVILFNDDQSANVAAISSAINSYYGAY